MANTIAVRALDANHDPMWGQGQANFIYDIYAVAQIIQTRLLLLQGEWWASLADGLPVLQEMLGVSGSGRNSTAVSLAIQNNILGAPYVTSVEGVQTIYNPGTRAFQFTCLVNTVFGQLNVSGAPGLSAVVPL